VEEVCKRELIIGYACETDWEAIQEEEEMKIKM
jgi:hypothetical protein